MRARPGGFGLRMPLGYLLGGLVLVVARPSPKSTLVGLALALLGQALRLWASGHIEKTRSLATGGPYAHTRNPLYLGSFLIGLGLAVAAASPWAVLAVAAYFAVFYPGLIRSEADFLRGRFPEAYANWERDVPAFLPRFNAGGPRETRFTWQRVRSNKEWRTTAAIPLFAVLLYVRGRFGIS